MVIIKKARLNEGNWPPSDKTEFAVMGSRIEYYTGANGASAIFRFFIGRKEMKLSFELK